MITGGVFLISFLFRREGTTSKAMNLSFASTISVLFVTLISFLFSAYAYSDPYADIHQHALLAFKAAMASDPRGSLLNWNPNITFCRWTGVKCSQLLERVVELNLANMGLQGSISPSLANVSFLQSLDLSNNYLYGFIPPELRFLNRLRRLDLSSNELEGHIPSELGALNLLQIFSLGENRLSGSIPISFASCPELIELDFEGNSISGEIPARLGVLTNLQVLSLGQNRLTGVIPADLGSLSHLQRLSLGENGLSGSIPISIANCSELIELDLEGNSLSGTIPARLGALHNLQILSLGQNQLTGEIPAELGSLPRVRVLSIRLNQFVGKIPKTLSNCSQLRILDLSGNELNGTVPVELGKLILLERLSLFLNSFVSDSHASLPILASLVNCSLLNYIDLSFNSLSGVLPLSIDCLSTKLFFLSLADNFIEGNIPPQVANLTNLGFLNLSHNLLSGTIPSAFRNFQKLKMLHLNFNLLHGTIPKQIDKLQALQRLLLGRNRLEGLIPHSLANIQELRYLTLNGNQLTGRIPSSLGSCRNLEVLHLSHNRLSGSIPLEVASLVNLISLNLSGNSLEGDLPSDIGKLVMVEAIDISANQISGGIPDTLGNCKSLELLDLSRNAFQGTIPPSLGKLRGLSYIDLSFNNLSGNIPTSLDQLQQLSYANFSFNNLAGELPNGRFAPCVSGASSTGNPCPRTSSAPSHLKRVIVLVVGICGFILCCLLALFFCNHRLHCWSTNVAEFIEPNLGYPRISYQKLFNATNGFHETNLLGAGNFGAVYEGMLSDGTVVAIKVFNLQNEEAHRSFRKECKILGRIRHRNLVRIITSYSNLDFKCLVLEYMSHGSLHNYLYPDEDMNNNGLNALELDLKRVVNIATDIAEGMAYLHHHCFVQVVHCDLKPSNVLLDDTLTAHVTDFGIARLTCPQSTDSLSTTLALNGSVGYIAPEYGLGERISTKGDVYSYGVMLLEMLTRKKPTDNIFSEGQTLRQWVNRAFPTRTMEVADKSLTRDLNNDGMDQQRTLGCLGELIHLGLLCSEHSPRDRPTMIDIVAILHNIKVRYCGIKEPPKLPLDISPLLATRSVIGNNVEASQSYSSSTFQ